MKAMENLLGLDLGARELKLVELAQKDPKEENFELVTFAAQPTPAGVFFSEAENDRRKLAQAIEGMVKEAEVRGREVVSAFPEAQVFTRVIEIPQLNDEELATALRFEVENYLPVPMSDIKYDYVPLEKGISAREAGEGDSVGRERMRVLLVAAPNSLIENLYTTLRWAGLEPVAFETELISLQRSLMPEAEKLPTTLILSMGTKASDLAVVHEGKMQLTRSIGTAGEALVKAITRELGFEETQAIEYLKSYGLREDQLEGKIMQIVKPVLDILINEIERLLVSYQARNPSRPVKRVVLTGTVAQMPGWVVYLAESLNLEVQIGDPWTGINIPEKLKESAFRVENQLRFAVAVGLAKKIRSQ